MTTINQRLILFFEYTGLDAVDFYKKIGANRIEWSGWITSAKPISVMKLQKILMAFPELNARWLIVGEGEMLYASNKDQVPVKTYDEIEHHRMIIEPKITTYSCPDCIQKEKLNEVLVEMISSKQETIDTQKVAIETLRNLIATLQGDEGKNAAQNCG